MPETFVILDLKNMLNLEEREDLEKNDPEHSSRHKTQGLNEPYASPRASWKTDYFHWPLREISPGMLSARVERSWPKK